MAQASPTPPGSSQGSRPKASSSSQNEAAIKMAKRYKEPRTPHCLGKGGFADIMQGLDMETGALVAIKKMVIDKSRLKKDQIERIVTEITTMKAAHHPNIIRYLAAGRMGDSELWIIMECAVGGSVARLLDRFGPLPEQLVRRYVADSAAGLAFLHGQGVAHRDLKCENLLLCDGGCVKVADFGCAKQISEEGGMTGTLVGTPLFMSPEMAMSSLEGNNSKYDPFAADVWTLGITTIQMFLGKPPFNQLQWMQHCQKPDAVVPLPPGISAECEEFLKMCLVRNPKERATIPELLRTPFLSGGGSGANNLASPITTSRPPLAQARSGSDLGATMLGATSGDMSKALESTRWGQQK